MSCPREEQLRSLLAGACDPGQTELLTAHLELCPTCRKTLDRLAGMNDSWPALARCLEEGQGPSPPALRRAMAGLHNPTTPEDASTLPPEEGGPSVTAGPAGVRSGHYQVQALLGQGGMGKVHRAFDPHLHRVVAIKVMAETLAANGSARQRFLREARAVAAVVHEHVVVIHQVDEAGGLPYLVMEFVAGLSLQERIDRDGPLPLKDILRIGMQTALGLAAAHKQGSVHRDVKPANILLENGVERVKLTDFGLARAVDDASLTQSGVIAGTPQYMSPEQANGEHVDHRSDLFSLGSVLYATATGRAPFRASNTMGVLMRVVQETPRPIRGINPDVPEWLCDIIARLQAKNASDRYESAHEVAKLLERRLARLQQPAEEGPPSQAQPSRSTRLPRRTTGLRVLAASALLLVLAVAAGLGWKHLIPHGNSPPDDRGPPPAGVPAAMAVAPFDEQRAKAYQEAWAKQLGVDVEFTNSAGMKMRLIPPGEFMMGSTPEEVETYEKDVPDYARGWVRSETPNERSPSSNPIPWPRAKPRSRSSSGLSRRRATRRRTKPVARGD